MIYTIIAGVNGSGKSTIYHSGEMKAAEIGVRLNVDELIQKKYNNQWQDSKIQFEASRHITNQINACIAEKKSFNQETTLSGKSIIQTIKKAKKQGFRISLHYVGLESIDLSIERVKNRAENMGHSIDETTLRTRYPKSFENLKEILPLCNDIYIYDNSNNYETIIEVKDGEINFINKNIPDYLKETLSPYLEFKA